MKNILLILLACCLSTMGLQAQIFNNSYTVKDQTYSAQSSMVIDKDGSTTTVHTIREYPNSPVYDARVVKVDDQGNVLWSKQFGIQGVDDRANGICKTDDDGYLIVGIRDDNELGYGSWVFRLDNGGNLQWSRWYSDPDLFISEGFLATRTFEDEENYMVVGTVNYPRRIYAMKIDAWGNLHWSHQYYNSSLVNSKYDYVTSMVLDEEKEGYIIAGTEHDYYTTGFSQLDLFTIGIGINGNLTRRYRKYDLDLGDNENNPHIIRNIKDDGFIMAFGIRAAGVQNNTVSFIATLDLNNNLKPIVGNLYASPNAYESHANSIYVDPHGAYDLGCFIYDGIEGQSNGVRNPSFLRLEPNGNPVHYLRYNVDQDQTCTFMAQDFTSLHENYVLKTDHIANGIWSVGLIRTELNGESKCMKDEPINRYTSHVNFWKQPYKRYSFAENIESPVEEWEPGSELIHCHDLTSTRNAPSVSDIIPPASDQVQIITSEETKSGNNRLVAYPTLMGKNITELTLDYSTDMDAEVSIMIYNVQGQLIYETEQEVSNGSNRLFINSSQLHQGMNTIVLLEGEGRTSTARVVKL